jgi:fucose 4-O-acetylase-like acetyltransferase
MEKTLPPHKTSRSYGLDWLRVVTTYLIIPIHVAIVFSPLPFYHIRNGTVSRGMLIFLALVEPWIMPLFFVLAGWAIYPSLRSRGSRQFLRERVQKLFIPLLAGSLLLGPPIKYLELRSGFDETPLSQCSREDPTHRFGPCLPVPTITQPFDESFFEFWPTFFTRFERFSWSHLWFLGYLFTFSVLYLPLFAWLARASWNILHARAAWLYFPMLPLFLIELTLRPYWPGMQNLYRDWANWAYYSICLTAGFLLARSPALAQSLNGEWKRALWIGLAGLAIRVPTATGFLISPTLSSVGQVVAGWGTILALIGFAQSRRARANAALGYLGESAFPVYILHQVAVVGIGYAVIQLPFGIPVKYVLLLVAASAATLAVYHFVVRPIPILRFAFGMKVVSGTVSREQKAVSSEQ